MQLYYFETLHEDHRIDVESELEVPAIAFGSLSQHLAYAIVEAVKLSSQKNSTSTQVREHFIRILNDYQDTKDLLIEMPIGDKFDFKAPGLARKLAREFVLSSHQMDNVTDKTRLTTTTNILSALSIKNKATKDEIFHILQIGRETTKYTVFSELSLLLNQAYLSSMLRMDVRINSKPFSALLSNAEEDDFMQYHNDNTVITSQHYIKNIVFYSAYSLFILNFTHTMFRISNQERIPTIDSISLLLSMYSTMVIGLMHLASSFSNTEIDSKQDQSISDTEMTIEANKFTPY